MCVSSNIGWRPKKTLLTTAEIEHKTVALKPRARPPMGSRQHTFFGLLCVAVEHHGHGFIGAEKVIIHGKLRTKEPTRAEA